MQILINGLLQGILIGTIGVAFALVYRTTKVFHVALGGVYALAPFIAFTVGTAGSSSWVGVIFAVMISVCLGVLMEEIIHWPFARKGAPTEVHLIGSLGAYLVAVQCIALIWGNETHVLREGVDTTWAIGGIMLAQAQIVGPALAFVSVLVLFAWLSTASRGLDLRALADNPTLVALLGRNVRALRRWVFGLSATFAAISALAQAWDFGFDPHVGLKAVLLGMVATIIGGTGNFIAPFVGGVLLGILRAEVVWFGSARWEEAATFVLLALFLFFLPQGIFARRARLEEDV